MSTFIDNKLSTIRDRFIYIVDTQKESSERKLAEKLGISPQRLNKVIKNGTEPSTELISLMVDKLGVDPLWLLNGKGQPFPTKANQSLTKTLAEEPPPNYIESNAKLVGYIPSLASVRFFPDMMVSAGYAEMLSSNQTEMLPVSFSPTSEEVNKGVAVKVYGDSMEPAISEGAIVFLMPLTQAEWLRISKGVFLFDTESTLTIKRISQNNLLGTPPTITLQADNPKYPNLTFNAESINAIWKVTHILNQPVQ
jgi:phage repressor protein C with HTH and peptisase S24 domain